MWCLDLCAGIGGITLAAEWAGMTPVGFCEIDPFPQKVLKKHWPDVPIIDDIRTITKQLLVEKGVMPPYEPEGTSGAIDLISCGYP